MTKAKLSQQRTKLRHHPQIKLVASKKHSNIQKEHRKQSSREKHNTGLWSNQESFLFLKAYCEIADDWKKISQFIGTRTVNQVRSYAQKAFFRMKEARQMKLNLAHAHDHRYSIHHRPVTQVIQLEGSSRKYRSKRLKRLTRWTELEQKALQLFETAKTHKVKTQQNFRVQQNLRVQQSLPKEPIPQNHPIHQVGLSWQTYRVWEFQKNCRELRSRQARPNQGDKIQMGLMGFQKPRQQAVTILTRKNN